MQDNPFQNQPLDEKPAQPDAAAQGVQDKPPVQNQPPIGQQPPPGQPPYGRQPPPPASGYGTLPPYGFAPPLASMPAAPAAPKQKKSGAPFSVALIAISLALVVLVAILLGTFLSLNSFASSLLRPANYNTTPPSGSFSVVRVIGTIQNAGSGPLGMYDPSYHHADTVAHIKALAQNEENAGILLYMNTPGGGVNEGDEVYLALMDYKEKTGRPIWAYMGDTCASAGYYIAASADHIVANRNTITGSIGVYIAMTDTSGLYEKLGVETVLIKSGENKGVGMEGLPITQEQRAVYQSVVDEMYDRFVQIVADGRGMSLPEVRALSDGRIYSAQQALENGLIDEVSNWDSVLAAFQEETGATPFYPEFSRATTLGQLLGTVFGQLPKSEAQTLLELVDSLPSGVPVSYYDPAMAA